MTVEEFIEKWKNAPLDLEEIARISSKITDHEIAKVAKEYIKSLENLEKKLEEVGFE